jgi:hypothetical protein
MTQKTISPKEKVVEEHYKGNGKLHDLKLKASIHRRILNFLNEATRPDDLMFEKVITHDEGNPIHEDNFEDQLLNRKKILDYEISKEIIEFRNREYPFGFRHLKEVMDIKRFDRRHLDILFAHLADSMFGSWAVLPYNIVRPGAGGGAPVATEVVHAALLHTGKVLFIPADFSNANWPTPIWDPNDEVNPLFEYPVNNPDYSLLCSGHAFLSDGKLLVVGGGGDRNVTPTAWWGFKFDPFAKTWTRTAGRMDEYKWYPTAVALEDKKILVVCGNTLGEMEIYNENTDSFESVSGDTLGFPNLYPGLHVLPNGAVFYSRTGWGSATSGTPASNDNSAYFAFSGLNAGAWTGISPSTINRCKGMSVMILQNSFPTLRILAVGGTDASGNGINSAEVIDLSVLSAAATWAPTGALPDMVARRQCNAVLLPDNTVFVSGGATSTNSPCMLYDPATNSWSAMDDLPSRRGYHSVSILLPSGKVMMAGGTSGEGNSGIEIFSPPYLFRGARPVISNAPNLVHHGQSFVIESPDAATITKVVLVRPMAVTHQTDAEQRVLEMPYIHDHANPTRLTLTAPHGGHPHAIAPMGYYMMFAINNNGVPSVAKWVYLH